MTKPKPSKKPSIRPQHQQNKPADVVNIETHRLLRKTLGLTSAQIEAIDLELAAEAGLLKKHSSNLKR